MYQFTKEQMIEVIKYLEVQPFNIASPLITFFSTEIKKQEEAKAKDLVKEDDLLK